MSNIWRYIKGSEADFEGAPEWATVKGSVSPNGKVVRNAFEGDGKYMYIDGPDKRTIFRGEFMDWDWLNTTTLIAKRERVTETAQTRLNDDRLTRDLIAERGERYGKFAEGAAIMQQLKQVTHNTQGWSLLSDSQKEALDMITHKIGYMLNGDPNYDDNWKDIAGYATLVADELNGVRR